MCKRHSLNALIILTLVLLTGCASNKYNSTVHPDYLGKKISVESMGICGPGATMAAHAFIAEGYRLTDYGADSSFAVEKAKTTNADFLAIVDPVGTDQAVWSGLFSFGMRVTNLKTGYVVWSANAVYGTGGATIQQAKSTQAAMQDMVRDFAKTFPPAPQTNNQGSTPGKPSRQDRF